MNKEKIIKKSEDFTKIINSNIKVKSKYFSVYYMKSEKNHYGITVPKKIGNAVTRNKIKRQLKNIIYKKWYNKVDERGLVGRIWACIGWLIRGKKDRK